MSRKPFFARFLEGTAPAELPAPAASLKAGARQTDKYPSDGDDSNTSTLKFPSDGDDKTL